MTDVIVTGLPRAGSTLVSALIDYLPDTISLNMPVWQMNQAKNPYLDSLPYSKWLAGDFRWIRSVLLNGESIPDIRAADGQPFLDGMFDPRMVIKEIPQEDGNEPLKEPELYNTFKADLSEQFTLAMRYTTFYTSLLPSLVKFRHFKIIAVIRHPLDVINSWRQLPQPMIGRGLPHGIARFWPEALAMMEAKMEAADRFVQLYELFLQRYHELREHIHVVKYEDVIDNPALISEWLGVKGISAGAALIEKMPRVRITSEAAIFRERFRKYGVYTKLYYPDI